MLFLLFMIFNIQNLQFNLGILFLFFWFVYLICYLVCFFKPVSIPKIFGELRRGGFSALTLPSSNYLFITIYWFSGYFVLSILIDTLQQLFGIKLGSPLTDNPLASFLYLTAAPLNEEIFFRVILLGIPLFFIFVPFDMRSLIGTLVHPFKFIPFNKSRYIIVSIILINSLFFGLAHVIFGGGYEIGKITQAGFGGLFLGWLYYRYGLVMSITFHWISNYVLFAFGLLGFLIFKTPWNTESDNLFMGIISSAFIVMGTVFLIQFLKRSVNYMWLKKSKKNEIN